MKKFIIVCVCVGVSLLSKAQVSNPEKVIKLGSEVHFINELNLDHNKEYGVLAKDIQELFPSLIKEKRINERFGKNAYRTKVIKVVNEEALIPAIVSSIQKQSLSVQDLKSKLITIERKM